MSYFRFVTPVAMSPTVFHGNRVNKYLVPYWHTRWRGVSFLAPTVGRKALTNLPRKHVTGSTVILALMKLTITDRESWAVIMSCANIATKNFLYTITRSNVLNISQIGYLCKKIILFHVSDQSSMRFHLQSSLMLAKFESAPVGASRRVFQIKKHKLFCIC